MNSLQIASKMNQTGRVLVVDGQKDSRQRLRDILEIQGHQVSEAAGGKEALAKVAEQYPDAIVLDMMMPEMDGLEVCRRLKSDMKTASIPILLVTGLEDRADRLKGIAAGANDFLSKPIDIEDLSLRVGNAIYTKHLFNHLEARDHQLRESEALRTSLMAMIIHDLIGPLRGMKVFLHLLQDKIQGKLAEDEVHNLDWAVNFTDYLAREIHSLLDISRLGAGELPLKLSRSDLRKVVQEAVATLAFSMGRKRAVFRGPASPVWASIDPEVMGRVITHLLENVFKISPKSEGVEVKVEKEEGRVWVRITDKNPGMAAAFQEKIFENFSQGETLPVGGKYSIGLDLTFCRLAVQAHGGQVIIESKMGQGSTFQFWLPAIPETVSPIVPKARAARKKRR